MVEACRQKRDRELALFLLCEPARLLVEFVRMTNNKCFHVSGEVS